MYLKYFLDTWIILELVVLTTCALKFKYKANLGVQMKFIKCMNALLFYTILPGMACGHASPPLLTTPPSTKA